jgi:hypothetical protein
MRRIKIAGLAVLFAICWVGLQPAANTLEEIGMARQGDSIAVTVTTSADCEYNVFLTDSKPERIVIDLSGVINDLPEQRFMDLPAKSIRSIRTSQYKSAPEVETRVVLDINRPIEFASSRDGNSVIVKFAAVPDEFASVDWESSDVTDAFASAPVAQKPPAEEAVEPSNDVEETPATAENSENETDQDSEETAEAVPAPAEEPQAVSQTQAESSSITLEEEEPEVVPQVADNTPMPAVSQGSAMDTAPKRKTVDYTADSEKDPFESLIGKVTGQMAQGLPSLENLKLVGILEDSRTSSALLEDGEGNGYILKPNDRIQSGYLISVSDNKATFQITEYGWTRTVALELQIPGIK